jgi:SpoVK/Ycf46/Vps4 family AAA+-type ATPase
MTEINFSLCQAIFSLARKARPCVVFLDEVDSVFTSRGHKATELNGASRQIINQFMAEWDGISALDAGVLILGATNRPFDLDDGVLRRMPRRIFFDLPNEEDRHAILKLHLVGETMDPGVDLASIAKHTVLYSGSDLKNICVSAALRAVTEQITKEGLDLDKKVTDSISDSLNAKAKERSGREKRIIFQSYFEDALNEVAASISENMESIRLLRKFAREFGGQKGNLRGQRGLV